MHAAVNTLGKSWYSKRPDNAFLNFRINVTEVNNQRTLRLEWDQWVNIINIFYTVNYLLKEKSIQKNSPYILFSEQEEGAGDEVEWP